MAKNTYNPRTGSNLNEVATLPKETRISMIPDEVTIKSLEEKKREFYRWHEYYKKHKYKLTPPNMWRKG